MSDRPPVLELIRDRLAAGPDAPSDGHMLGLAVEGGGMRGIVAAAALIALHDLGLLPVFDGIYGTSAGSINAAYVLAGQPWAGLSIYYDHLATGDFIDKGRARRWQPVVSMAAVRKILDHEVPLQRQRVIDAVPPLHVAVSNLKTGKPELRTGFRTPEELDAALLAGAHLPVLAGKPIAADGGLYCDGGLYFPHPMYAAIAGDCTHVLSVASRAQGPPRTKLSAWQFALVRILNHWAPGAGDSYLQTLQSYIEDRKTIGYGEIELHGSKVYRLATVQGGHGVERLTTDRMKLLDGARVGYADAYKLFRPDQSDAAWVYAFRPGEAS